MILRMVFREKNTTSDLNDFLINSSTLVTCVKSYTYLVQQVYLIIVTFFFLIHIFDFFFFIPN